MNAKPASSITPGQIYLPVRRPMLAATAVCALTGVAYNQITPMIEDGRLAWAWNIARKNTTRVCPRVLTASVADFAALVAQSKKDMEQIVAILGSPDSEA